MLRLTENSGYGGGGDADTVDISCILSHALAEWRAGEGPLTERLGLSGADLGAFRDRFLPGRILPDPDLPAPSKTEDQRAIEMLILWRAGQGGPEVHWFASILARRSLEKRHLWEDLGLNSRAALGGMIRRHLPGLAAANHMNMRWKKFFYRQICSESGFSLCLSPSCEECDERDECFAPE